MIPSDQGHTLVWPGRLTLTFDNGPTPGVTERVLDILAHYRLPATFFVIGRRLRDPAAAALLPMIASGSPDW
jgi:peptidoglycan-N-acetylglucosamine deacetylase